MKEVLFGQLGPGPMKTERTRINEVKRLIEITIDYAAVETQLNKEKIRSLHWLEHTLKAPKDYKLRI